MKSNGAIQKVKTNYNDRLFRYDNKCSFSIWFSAKKNVRCNCIAYIYLKATYRIHWQLFANTFPTFSLCGWQRQILIFAPFVIHILSRANALYDLFRSVKLVLVRYIWFCCYLHCFFVYFCVHLLHYFPFFAFNPNLAPVYRFQNIRQNEIDFIRIKAKRKQFQENHQKKLI